MGCGTARSGHRTCNAGNRTVRIRYGPPGFDVM